MLYSRANLEVLNVAGGNPDDPVLNQVRLEPDGSTVASNGHAMMIVEPVQEVPPSMPDLRDIDPPSDGLGVRPDVVQQTIKNLPKGNLALELGFAALTKVDTVARAVELTTTDLNLQKKTEGGLARKLFPEWKNIIRGAVQGVRGRVAVNRKELMNLVKAMSDACPDPDDVIFIEFGDKGLVLKAQNVHSKQRAIGYMTPLDTHGQWLKPSRWETKLFRRAAKRRILKEKSAGSQKKFFRKKRRKS